MEKTITFLVALNIFFCSYSQTSYDLYKSGVENSNLGLYNKAIVNYTDAIKINSNYSSAYVNRGICYVALKKYALAVSDYNSALKYEPNSADIYYNRGIAKTALKDYNGSIKDFNATIKLDVNFYQAYYSRGVNKMDIGKLLEAIDDFTKAISIAPNDSEGKEIISESYYNKGNSELYLNKLKEAKADYLKAIEINPKLDIAYGNMAITNSKLLDFNSAIMNATKAIELNQNVGSYYLVRGMAKLKKNLNACIDLQKALSLGENDAQEFINKNCNQNSIKINFNTQTLATWDREKNDWFKGGSKIDCFSEIYFFNDSTIKFHYVVKSTNKTTDKIYKWSEKKDKNSGGRNWTNYKIATNKNPDFYLINFERNDKNEIIDALLINDNTMLVFYNK